jgi:hypothetical protein
MTGKLDSIMVPLADSLITDFGKTATYKQVTSTFSASTGKTTSTETPSTVIVTPPAPYKQNRIDGTVVQTGDVTCNIAGQAISFTPQIGDRINLNSLDWQIVGVNPVFSGEQIALYKLQLRL